MRYQESIDRAKAILGLNEEESGTSDEMERVAYTYGYMLHGPADGHGTLYKHASGHMLNIGASPSVPNQFEHTHNVNGKKYGFGPSELHRHLSALHKIKPDRLPSSDGY